MEDVRSAPGESLPPVHLPFASHYTELAGERIHYLDEGRGPPPLLMLHGNPTWSYLYRTMIPPLVAAGYRCVVPDLLGFGRSDKPSDESRYTLRRHVELMTGLVERLGLSGLIPVGQDWGGTIGLRYGIDHRANVRALIVLDTLVRADAGPEIAVRMVDFLRDEAGVKGTGGGG